MLMMYKICNQLKGTRLNDYRFIDIKNTLLLTFISEVTRTENTIQIQRKLISNSAT